ncbi:30S ribosomal protein S11 [Candidatus Pacearchaeota archaeon CG_4_9_14_3_um_filter_31_7]|nr:MAG: 30S ribosomal protein S11 [Candidatus Pacearchaeota archaeon CG1_02_31_27]PIN92421.1 MAG: 30S ribosomal protein S11 [Candidatus Pacearchaeota archaeon CG10_big_fil_rev_8_21_14_0_10_31_59]PIZ81006.1 MAG: 30S ribosomal protein S11 [Candidatus Pacearchaeota archaeon CG_4_10_14_0_2_um_filter_31_10]PJA70503.1 MAG: 30S ribosomal protein S11 [Candidatus Pacearchaeota archaeon CG_4_9_14_3_um_filter_31_7]
MSTEEIAEEKVEEKPKENNTGIVYIYATYNNTIIHITDMVGNTLAKVTGGRMTKQSRLKANPTVAMFAAKKAAEQVRDLGITQVFVKMRAKGGKNANSPGPGAHATVKSLAREGIRVLNILDTTPIPRGGPKPAGGKRGRRV